MREIGETIDPATPLQIWRKGAESTVTLGDLLTRPTIVSVYMGNNTGSCDKQNISLADHAESIDNAGFNLVAISRDGLTSHSRYAEKLKIPYTLASDPEDQFARAANAIVNKRMYGKTFTGPARAAFILSEQGVILGVIPKVKPAAHGAELMELISSL